MSSYELEEFAEVLDDFDFPCKAIIVDNGIGHYEFWGQPGYHHCYELEVEGSGEGSVEYYSENPIPELSLVLSEQVFIETKKDIHEEYEYFINVEVINFNVEVIEVSDNVDKIFKITCNFKWEATTDY